MKIGVYNEFWTTFGGGEQHACGFVDALAVEHDVEIIGPDPVDLDELRERLGARLDGVTFRRIGDDDDSPTAASVDYELFLNHSYRSTAANAAAIGIYSVMFPHILEGTTRRRLVDRLGIPAERGVRILGSIDIAGGEAVLEGAVRVQVPRRSGRLDLQLGSPVPMPVRIVEAGARGTATDVEVSGHTPVSLDLSSGSGLVVVAPREASAADGRLTVDRIVVDGMSVPVLPSAPRQRLTRIRHRGFLSSYDRVVANSEYTRRWTERRWGRCDEAVEPPVVMREPGNKERLILSLGRFFAPESGHSKRQLDLVEAFRRLVESGVDDWRLVLIGGCSPKDREYAMAVRRAMRGLPGEVRLSADRVAVDEHLAAASIFWHAAGFGSDLDRHPERAEHFGIAPIEAMSAGAVPVVFGAAGPAGTVVPGVSGFHFNDLDDLVAITRRLIDDPALRERTAARARERALEFDESHFAERVGRLVRSAAEAAPHRAAGRM